MYDIYDDWWFMMTSQSEHKVIPFHECATGYGASRGGAMRPQPGNTCIVNKSQHFVLNTWYGCFCNDLFNPQLMEMELFPMDMEINPMVTDHIKC